MNILTFNPGPSYLSPEVIQWIHELAESGYLSTSHRSSRFMEVCKQAVEGLREKMHIPKEYKIFFQPSATVAIDTILRNVVTQKSFHFVHGAFSGLFQKTALEIGLDASQYEVPWNVPITWQKASISNDIELIAVTHNETSSGLMWPRKELHQLRSQYPTQLLAIDVASSFGAMKMDWNIADIWFGSVQKCLGLPSGLGFILVGPRAFEKAKNAKGVASWQSFMNLDEKIKTFQTPETPNMFDIALLARQMTSWNLEEIENKLMIKSKLLYESSLTPYISSVEWRSSTVTCFSVVDPEILHAKAKTLGIVLGKGYGLLKDSTIRIANFPAITVENIQFLLRNINNDKIRA